MYGRANRRAEMVVIFVIVGAFSSFDGWSPTQTVRRGMDISNVRCRFAYGPADATATHCLAPVKPHWFYLSGTAHPGSPRPNPEEP